MTASAACTAFVVMIATSERITTVVIEAVDTKSKIVWLELENCRASNEFDAKFLVRGSGFYSRKPRYRQAEMVTRYPVYVARLGWVRYYKASIKPRIPLQQHHN